MRTRRVVLITGGTSGIGLSLAEAFLAQGAAVAVCGRSQQALDRFAREHPEALAIQADITDPPERRSGSTTRSPSISRHPSI